VIRHLNGLIFDCLSFTEDLITSLSTTDSETPVSSSSLKKTEVEHLQKWKKNIGFNNMIGLNQKILILNRFATDKMIL
jgi:hypothetical protein